MGIYQTQAECGCLVEYTTYNDIEYYIKKYCWKHWLLSFCSTHLVRWDVIKTKWI